MPEQQIAVDWTTEARADLRAIDRDTALQILYCWRTDKSSASAAQRSPRP